ncbi:MAG: DUF3224 domain-containing protein [Actinomycetota bacterium]
MTTAKGTFDVTLVPIDGVQIDRIGAMSIDKTFAGDLVGTSGGAMMSTGTPEPTSAGYVALEWVTATIEGRSGTFALQHTGVMDRGEGALTITVLPDSGTDALTGLRGTMSIDIVDGEHRYTFDYEV